MKLHYQKHLKPYAKKLRKAGNLSEILLWDVLKQDKLGHRFLRQRPIGRYIVDFYCHSLNLVIEIDGVASHDAKIEIDEERQKELELLGAKVIRFTDTEVRFNLHGVRQAIEAEILRLAAPPLGKEEKSMAPSNFPFIKGDVGDFKERRNKSSGFQPPPLEKEE